MFISNKHVSRRTVLRGMGAAVALPFIEAMVPARRVFAQGAASNASTALGAGKKLRFVEARLAESGKPFMANDCRLDAKRRMPLLSPSACRIACPSTIAVSSTVWCASMWTSPVASTFRSSEPCTPNAVSLPRLSPCWPGG